MLENNNNRVAVLVERDFEDSEFTETVRAMNDAGVKAVIVGSGSQKSYRGRRGKSRAVVDITADKVKVEQFGVKLIRGCWHLKNEVFVSYVIHPRGFCIKFPRQFKFHFALSPPWAKNQFP